MNKIEKMPVTEPPDETAPKAHDKPAGPSAVPPPPSKWLFAAVLVVVALVLGYGALGHWRTDAAAAETQREAIDFGHHAIEDQDVVAASPRQFEAFTAITRAIDLHAARVEFGQNMGRRVIIVLDD